MWTTTLYVLVIMGACAHGGASPPSAKDASVSEKIDLDLKDVDICEALGAVATKARVNIFADSDLGGRVSIDVHALPWDEVLAQIARDHQLRVERLDVPALQRAVLWISKESSPPAPQRTFTGAPIEFSFDDTPIRSAVATFAAAANTTIVVDDDVQAGIELRGRGIPWDLALYHLAQKYELRIVRTSDQIRITRR